MVSAVRFCSAVLFLLLSQWVSAAISSEIDRTRVEQGDAFILTLNISANEASQIDLEPLYQDFQVLGRSHQSSASYQNGELTTTTQLAITLSPKRAGQLVVPALTLDGEKSQEHKIQVVAVNMPSAVDGGVEFLSTLSDKTPNVQQPIIYQSSLVVGRKLFDARIQEPQVREGKALIETLGQQRQFMQELNGQQMLVVEQSWLITPQQSGVLKIDGARLSAQVQDRQQRRDPFGSFNRRGIRRIFVAADDYALDVAPIPSAFSGNQWVIAEDISLKSSFDTDSWQQGEPVTRTITLEATGLTKEQVPSIVPPEVAGIKQYAAKPVVEQEYIDGALKLRVSVEVTMIPERAGDLRLPAIELPWWDSENDKQQLATLAATDISIAADPNANNLSQVLPEVVPQPQQQPTQPVKTAPEAVANTETKPQRITEPSSVFAPWLLVLVGALLGALIAVVAMLLWLRKRPESVVNAPSVTSTAVVGFDPKQLKQACLDNKPKQAREQLTAWARYQYSDCQHLNDLAQQVDQAFQDQIAFLNRSCFANDDCPWDGKQLWQQIEAAQKRKKPSDSQRVELAPLYK